MFINVNQVVLCDAGCVLMCPGVFWCDPCVFCGAFDASGPPPAFGPGASCFCCYLLGF